MRLCLDSSVIIDWLRQKRGEQTLFYQLLSDQHQLFVPMVVVAELFSGTSVWQFVEAKQRLEGTLAECRVLPIETSTAIMAGELRVKYQIPLFDGLIAATAIQNNLPLVTLNGKDFSNIDPLTLWSE